MSNLQFLTQVTGNLAVGFHQPQNHGASSNTKRFAYRTGEIPTNENFCPPFTENFFQAVLSLTASYPSGSNHRKRYIPSQVRPVVSLTQTATVGQSVSSLAYKTSSTTNRLLPKLNTEPFVSVACSALVIGNDRSAGRVDGPLTEQLTRKAMLPIARMKQVNFFIHLAHKI